VKVCVREDKPASLQLQNTLAQKKTAQCAVF